MNYFTSFKRTALLWVLPIFIFACGGSGGEEAPASPPSPPGKVTAVASDGQVSLSWDAVPGAVSYHVYRAAVSGVTKANYAGLAEGAKNPSAAPGHTDTGLVNGTTYYFVVTAVNGAGESAESAEESAIPTAPGGAPGTPVPAGVQAVPGDRQITLTWHPFPDATGYFVYRAETSGISKSNTATITGKNPVPEGTTTYTQKQLTNGKTYYFVVTAVTAAGESAQSAEISAAPFAGPQNLAASPGDHQVTLVWDPATAAASYHLYWVAKSPAQSPQCPLPSGAPAVVNTSHTKIENVASPFIHPGLTNGNTYYYVVTSVNAAGVESLPSKQTCAVPAPDPPPTAVTLPLEPGDATSAGSATLRGEINPNGFPITEAYFEWGVTTAYGNQLQIANPASIGSGNAFVARTVSIPAGLLPNTPYHYRIVAKNGNPNGTSIGADQGFVLPFLGAAHEYSIGADALSPNDLVIADFNVDGELDLATANYGSDDVSILIQAADRSFGPGVRYGAGSSPQFLAAGDFKQDGAPDLIVSNSQDRTVSLLLNDGAGAFGTAVSAVLSSDPHAAPAGLAVGDFDGDGNLDAAVSVPGGGVGNVAVLLGDGAGGLGSPILYPAGINPLGIEAGDFDGDGNLDLVVANSVTNSFTLLLGAGDGTFAAQAGAFPTPTQNHRPVAVVSGDFNQDTFPDLAAANNVSDTLSIFLNDGAGLFSAPIDFAVGSQPNAVESGDFNGDNRPDLIVPNFFGDSVTVYQGHPGVDFSGASVYTVGENPIAAASGDLNGDGKVDLAVANVSGNSVSVLLGE